jgi:hypothetical protein
MEPSLECIPRSFATKHNLFFDISIVAATIGKKKIKEKLLLFYEYIDG